MPKLRMKITKGESIRYISHLDYLKTFERILKRSNLPIKYSQGFNPHMKFSFSSALAVGVVSLEDYVDIELLEHKSISEIKRCFADALCDGIEIVEAFYVDEKIPSLMSTISQASYRVTNWIVKEDFEKSYDVINKFNKAKSIVFTRKHEKKRAKDIDLKEFLNGDIEYKLEDDNLLLFFNIKITPTGSIKPTDVLNVLVDIFELPIEKEAAIIDRVGICINKKE
ncbi:TIGR03936 family radical SAM-associated protein [Selenomonadales bacterium OttesenSCG-928-I06]|nr:TIGR03936 family radical SAM-associated protein [Selenomonadales bacterium OttesenSCG-928-I06]